MVRIKPEAIIELKSFASHTNCTPNTYAQEIIECYLAEKKMKHKALAKELGTIITRSVPKQHGPNQSKTSEPDPDYPLD
jgi:predicted DNA-binding protein